MKVNDRTRFPHPVLSAQTSDFTEGEFKVNMVVTEAIEKAEVALEYAVTLTESTIRKLVEEGKASAGIFVSCQETYFARLMPLSLAGGKCSFEPGSLLGRVVIRPVVWVRSSISDFLPSNCHPEFGEGVASFPAGTILALDEEVILSVGREKLAQIETIFTVARAAELESGTMDLELGSDRIRILVADDIFETVNVLRGLSLGRPVMLNSVFLPAVMQVLDSLREDAESYEGKRWHRVFTAKCDHLGVDIEHPDLWSDAQKILDIPFLKIDQNKEILGQ